MDRERWSRQAECKGRGDLFLRTNKNREQEWKRICASCPVLEMCRDYALLHEGSGNWGGMSRSERSAERKNNPDRITYLAYEAMLSGTLESHAILTTEQRHDAKLLLKAKKEISRPIPVVYGTPKLSLMDLSEFDIV